MKETLYQGHVIVLRFLVNCWDCGTDLWVGEDAVQGDDDHTYCFNCAERDGIDWQAA